MIVPLTLADFLERAEPVYGDRVAVVDEPDPPGGGLGRVTYAQFAAMARSLAAALDELGVGEGARVAIVSPNAARFLVASSGSASSGASSCPSTSGSTPRRSATSSSTPAPRCPSSIPRWTSRPRAIPVKHRIVLGAATRRAALRARRARRRATR